MPPIPDQPLPDHKELLNINCNSNCILKAGDEFADKSWCMFEIGKKSLIDGRQFRTRKSDKSRYDVVCYHEGCDWKIVTSKMRNSVRFRIGSINDVHTCPKTQLLPHHRNATIKLLGRLIAPKLKDSSRIYRPRDIKDDLAEAFNIDVSYKKAWAGKNRALEILSGCPTESFAQLPYYFHNLEMANDGWVTHIDTDDEGRFKMCFVAFGVAVSETGESWTWFLSCLKDCIGEVDDLAIISDRHFAIGLADDFQCSLGAIQAYKPEAYNKLIEAGVERWSRAWCPAKRYNYMTSNSAESVNALTKGVRREPITRFMDWYRGLLQRWYCERRDKYEGSSTEWEKPDGLQIVKPPGVIKPQSGRPKNKNRIRSQGELPTPVTCTRCWQPGHKREACRQPLPKHNENVGNSIWRHPSIVGNSFWQHPSGEGTSNPGQPSMEGTSGWVQPSMAGTSGYVPPSMAGTSGYVPPSMAGTSGWVQPSMAGTSTWGQPAMEGTSGWVQPSMAGMIGWGQSSMEGTSGSYQHDEMDWSYENYNLADP
ncbi:transposase, MuDR, MULE transposase domain protein [Artemisia annua]|uniref:Transposase, MuDR, MULE transposase domain protein n=1 Tax=Artemisia annua TaxID=35608 RepID=A0A2U1NW70_ARTAN|nr:transposase, MuDR, MULE transposase domain protein [Artemisia annua]